MWPRGYFAAPDAVEVLPGLHLGAQPGRRASRVLAKGGITQAVDLRSANDRPSSWPDGVTTLRFPLVEWDAPGLDALDRLSKRIASLIQQGEIAYLHCRAGVQRAPMVGCAVLVQMGWPLTDAFQLIRSRRAVADLSDDQVAVLRELYAKIRRETMRSQDYERLGSDAHR